MQNIIAGIVAQAVTTALNNKISNKLPVLKNVDGVKVGDGAKGLLTDGLTQKAYASVVFILIAKVTTYISAKFNIPYADSEVLVIAALAVLYSLIPEKLIKRKSVK